MKKWIALSVLVLSLSTFLVLEMGATAVVSSEDIKAKVESNKAQVLDLYSVAVRDTSMTGLSNYRNKVLRDQSRLLDAGKSDILTTFTFRSPISITDFESMVSEYDITIDRFAIRAITPNNERLTISGKPSTTELVPKSSLGSLIACSLAEFQGIIECYGVISSSNLKKINNDARVFLADTSADSTFIQNEYRKHIPSLYWFIEENGSK